MCIFPLVDKGLLKSKRHGVFPFRAPALRFTVVSVSLHLTFINRRAVSFQKQAQFFGASSWPGHPSVIYEETLSGSLVRLHDAACFHEDIHHKNCLGREAPTSPPQ